MSNSIFSREEIEELIADKENAKKFGKTSYEVFIRAVNSCTKKVRKKEEIPADGIGFSSSNKAILGPEEGSADLTPEEKKIIFGRENDEGILEKQLLLEKFLTDSICAFCKITKVQLIIIRKPEAKRTDEEKQAIAGLDVKPEEVNVLFDKCSRVINGEKLEEVLGNEVKNDEPQQNPEPINKKTPREQIAEMINNGNGSCEIKIGKDSYLFSEPETVLKKYVADLYLSANGINQKYLDKNNTEIKFTNDNEELEKGDYNKLFGGTDEDILKGDTAETIATKLRRKFVKETAAKAICNFYGIKVENLVGIIEKKEGLSEDEQKILNLFNDSKSVLVGKKTLVEIQEKKDNKEYSKIEKITWTADVEGEALHNMSKDPSRENLDYTQISFEELCYRLKDITGRTFNQIMQDIAKFVNDDKHSGKLRLNDALFGTGAFNPDKKKVKRKLRVTVWFKKLFAKKDTEYPLNENDPKKKKKKSVLKPNERKSYIVDMARGAFDACLRRMISLAPTAFDGVGIGLKKEEGHFARNLGKIRFFSSRWIRESFDLASGTRSDTSLFFAKPTKKGFFKRITDVYRRTPKLQALLQQDKMEIKEENNNGAIKYTLENASYKNRQNIKLEYNSDDSAKSIFNESDCSVEQIKDMVKNNQIDQLRSEIDKLNEQVAQAQSSKETVVKNLESMKAQAIADKNQEIENKNQEIANKDQEIAKLKKKRSKAEVNKEKDDKITELTKEEQALQERNKVLTEQNQNLEEQMSVATQNAQNVQTQIDQLQNENKNLKERLETAQVHEEQFSEVLEALLKLSEDQKNVIGKELLENIQNCFKEPLRQEKGLAQAKARAN